MTHQAATVIDWISWNAGNTPDATATVELPSGRVQSYAQMNERVSRIATWLLELGVKPGDRVGVLALNSTDTLDIVFATWRIGAVHLALNFRLTAPELDFIIGNAEPGVVIFDGELTATVEAITAPVTHWVETDGMGGDSDFEARTVSAQPTYQGIDKNPDDLCMLMYSSGTTGQPKGVQITHGNLLFSNMNALAGVALGPDSVNLTVMPLFHIGGLNVFAAPTLYAGGKVIVMRAFEPGATLDAFSDPDLGITHFLGVPAIFNALRDHPKNADADLSRVKTVIAGAEAVPEALVTWWYKRGLSIQEGYGMTENVASSVILPKSDVPARVGSAGKPLRHIEFKVMRELDDGSWEDCPDGDAGELWCRGPVVTPGYWRRPDANDETFVDGWLRTGDIGIRDAQGFYSIEDRVKDMYISGGENVYPAEIENVLYGLPQIREVAVIGVPDERWGETGCAIVVLQNDAALTAEELRACCQGKLARYKMPNHIQFTDVLPRNATGKVLKYQLREQWADANQ